MTDRPPCPSCPTGPGCFCLAAGRADLCDLVAAGDPAHRDLVARLGPPRFAPGAAGDGRVRVGLWCPCFGVGGAETWMLDLARHCDPAAVAFAGAVITEDAGHSDPARLARLRAVMPVGRGPADARALAAGCDVIVSWSTLDVAAALAGLDRRPRVIHAAHFDPACHAFPDPDLFAGVDRWVAVSEEARRWVHPRYRDATSVAWNCVDPERVRPARSRAEVRASWGVPADATVVGYLGRLEAHQKGADLLAGIDRYLDPAAWIVAVGAGNLLEPLRSVASPRFVLPGPDLDVGSVLGAFDRLVAPSRGESFGLSVAEGWAAGVPVVAPPVGIAAERPDLVMPIRADAGQLAVAFAVGLDLGLDDDARRRAEVARRFALDHLGPAAFGRRWTGLILDAAGPAHRPRSAALAAIRDCPDRGPVLPISAQDDCGCSGRERSACRAGKGSPPGRVTLDDCLACRGSSRDIPTE